MPVEPEEIVEIVVAQIDPVTVSRFLFSVIIVFALYLVAMALRKAIESRVEEPAARLNLVRAVNYTAAGLGLIVLGIIWLERLGGFSIALGILGASAVFAIREIITSIAGWLLITSGRAYRIGDRVELGNIRGDVIGFGLLRTTMLEIGNWVRGDQYTGRVITIANSAVFQQPLYNYTRYLNFVWDEIHVPVKYETNWRKAREICLRLAEEHSQPTLIQARGQVEEMSRRFPVSHTELSPAVYMSFDDNWVELSVRYLAPVRERRRVRNALSQEILAALQEAGDISIASETIALSGRLDIRPEPDGDRK